MRDDWGYVMPKDVSGTNLSQQEASFDQCAATTLRVACTAMSSRDLCTSDAEHVALGCLHLCVAPVSRFLCVQVIYSLPRAQPTAAKAFKLVEVALVSLLQAPTDPAKPAHSRSGTTLDSGTHCYPLDSSTISAVGECTESHASHSKPVSMQDNGAISHDACMRTSSRVMRLAVNYLLMLGRMSESYTLEKAAFLRQLQRTHGTLAGAHSPSRAAPGSPDAAATAKRACKGALCELALHRAAVVLQSSC